MKTPNPNQLENKQVKEIFLLILKGKKTSKEFAEYLKLDRGSVYDGINKLLSLDIISKIPKNKGFILNKKEAKQFINIRYQKEIQKFKEIKKIQDKIQNYKVKK